ncbi:MAG: hypothetical protein AAFO07_11580 [Bacteroidota bacterium]
MKTLNYLFAVVFCFFTFTAFSQTDTEPPGKTSTHVEVTYDYFLAKQEAYKKGEITKSELTTIFNQLADQLDEQCTNTNKVDQNKASALGLAQKNKVNLKAITFKALKSAKAIAYN